MSISVLITIHLNQEIFVEKVTVQDQNLVENIIGFHFYLLIFKTA